MRVQFSVDSDQWNALQRKAAKEGYPDVPSYCRDLALGDRTYGKLWNTVVDKISKMNTGQTFALRDLVDTPPSNMGVKLYNNQKSLGIKILKKDNLNTNVFIRL